MAAEGVHVLPEMTLKPPERLPDHFRLGPHERRDELRPQLSGLHDDVRTELRPELGGEQLEVTLEVAPGGDGLIHLGEVAIERAFGLIPDGGRIGHRGIGGGQLGGHLIKLLKQLELLRLRRLGQPDLLLQFDLCSGEFFDPCAVKTLLPRTPDAAPGDALALHEALIQSGVVLRHYRYTGVGQGEPEGGGESEHLFSRLCFGYVEVLLLGEGAREPVAL